MYILEKQIRAQRQIKYKIKNKIQIKDSYFSKQIKWNRNRIQKIKPISETSDIHQIGN